MNTLAKFLTKLESYGLLTGQREKGKAPTANDRAHSVAQDQTNTAARVVAIMSRAIILSPYRPMPLALKIGVVTIP